MVLDELATHCAANGIGTPGFDLFYGILPPDPDVCTALFEYGGMPSEPNTGSGGTVNRLVFPRIQVLTRGIKDDYDGPRIRAEQVVTLFTAILNQNIAGVRYLAVTPLQEPFPLRRDDNFRIETVCNYQVYKEPSTVASPVIYQMVEDFGGSDTAFLTPSGSDAYPAGSLFSALVPGSWPILLDGSGLYGSGSYVIEANAKVASAGARVKVALFNLTTAPNTVMTGSEITFSTSEVIGERMRSSAITIPAGSNQYGVKLTVNSTVIGGAAWGIRLLRV